MTPTDTAADTTTAPAAASDDTGTVGIQETTELLVGIGQLNAHVIKYLKDGFQPGADISQLAADLVNDTEYRAKLQAAIVGVGKIPAEIKDLKFNEGLQLTKVLYEQVVDVIAAARK